MLEEEQISFRSASPMFDGVEDYSHQIAEMIGLRNESNFREIGVCMSLLCLSQFISCGLLYFVAKIQTVMHMPLHHGHAHPVILKETKFN